MRRSPMRARSAMTVKKANGQPVGVIPYGLNPADDGTTLVENAAERVVIADIRAMRSASTTLKRIVATLTERDRGICASVCDASTLPGLDPRPVTQHLGG